MPKDISGTFFRTYFSAFFAMLDAFLVVYLYNIVLQADCLGRTGFDTYLAGDAAYFTHCLHLFARILSTAGNPNPGISGNKFDQILGASAHAGSTTHTQIRVHYGKIIDHSYSIERTGLSAVTITYASILARLRTAKGEAGAAT